MVYIAAKYLEKSSNPISSFYDKKKLCYTQKITHHLNLKTTVT